MGYIDVAIPLIAGIACLAIPDKFVKPTDPDYEKKKSLIKKCGYVLTGVAILYFFIKLFAK